MDIPILKLQTGVPVTIQMLGTQEHHFPWMELRYHFLRDNRNKSKLVRCKKDKNKPCKICDLSRKFSDKTDNNDLSFEEKDKFRKLSWDLMYRKRYVSIVRVVEHSSRPQNNGGLCYFSFGKSLLNFFKGEKINPVIVETDIAMKQESIRQIKAMEDIYCKKKHIVITQENLHGFPNYTDNGCYIVEDSKVDETDYLNTTLHEKYYAKTIKYPTLQEQDEYIAVYLKNNGIRYQKRKVIKEDYILV
jgi:hypothetical protein